MRVIIIEDEPFAQDELKRLIQKNYPDFQIVDVADSVQSSVECFQQNTYDLVLMDIQLTDGKSFEIFDQVQINTPIIFTTAYDEYALKAFQLNSIGYLLKPIDEQELIKAISKLSLSNFMPQPQQALQQLLQQFSPNQYKQRFVVKLGDKYMHLKLSEIAYFFSEDKISFIITHSNKKYIIDDSLETIEGLLNPKLFFRLSRNIIASIDAVAEVSKYFNSRLLIQLKPPFPDQVLVSRVKVAGFLNWLDS